MTASRDLAYSYLLEAKNIVEEAQRSDRIMPLWLPYLAVILAILSLALGFASEGIVPHHRARHVTPLLNTIATLLFIAAIILNVYVVYLWVKRRDDHFMRSHKLFKTVLNILETLDIKDSELAIIREKVDEMEQRERPRSPALWAILYIVFNIIWFYIAHFLNKDFVEHEMREMSIVRNLSRIMERRGVRLREPERSVPERSTLLYVILTIVTLGIFVLYWVYTLTNDANKHFIQHRMYERELIDSLEKLIEKA